MTDGDQVRIGKILRAHGIRGEVLLFRLGDAPGLLAAGAPLRVRRGDRTEFTLVVAEGRPFKGGMWIVSFEGVQTRTEAEMLAGASVVMDKAALPPAAEGMYYQFQIVGLCVVNVEGDELGRVTEVLETGARDVYVVVGPRGEWLLPAGPMVEKVDLEAGRITVRLIPGMLPGD